MLLSISSSYDRFRNFIKEFFSTTIQPESLDNIGILSRIRTKSKPKPTANQMSTIHLPNCYFSEQMTFLARSFTRYWDGITVSDKRCDIGLILICSEKKHKYNTVVNNNHDENSPHKRSRNVSCECRERSYLIPLVKGVQKEQWHQLGSVFVWGGEGRGWSYMKMPACDIIVVYSVYFWKACTYSRH